jgi:hypothetical protein
VSILYLEIGQPIGGLLAIGRRVNLSVPVDINEP